MGMGMDAKRKQSYGSLNTLQAKKVKTGSFHIMSTGKALLDNYNNFSSSGIPARMMYFHNGEWMDFPLETTNLLKQAFQSRNSVVEVVMAGLSYRVDFAPMMRTDLRTGCQTSIAWIDVDGKSFFPRVVCERNGELSDVRIEVDWRINGEAQIKPLKAQLLVHREEEKQGSSDSTNSQDGDGRPRPAVIMAFSLPVVKQSQQSFPLLVKDSSHHMQGHTRMPTSAWMPFPLLFSVMEKFLSSSSIRLLKQHYCNYKASKITREDLIRRLRMIAGDRVLTSIIKMFEGQIPHVN